jgi:hypothetical protein
MTCNLLLPILAWIIRTSHTAPFICLLVPNQQLAFGTCALPAVSAFSHLMCNFYENCVWSWELLPELHIEN